MRYRVSNYTCATDGTITLTGVEAYIEDIRLIVNETKKKIYCSSMQKDNITDISISEGNTVITIASTLLPLAASDKLTIEIDKGDHMEEYGATDVQNYLNA